jgi:hypothetical protein
MPTINVTETYASGVVHVATFLLLSCAPDFMQWLCLQHSSSCFVTTNESERRRRKNSEHFDHDSEFWSIASRHPVQATIGILAVLVPHACSERIYADAD